MDQFVRKSRGWGKGAPAAMLVSAVLLAASSASAIVTAEDMEDLSAGALVNAATSQMQSGNYTDSITYMQEYLVRVKELETNSVRTMRQKVRLMLGKLLAHEYRSAEAIPYFEQYTQGVPMLKPREAYKLLVMNAFNEQEYLKCVEAATVALTQPQPKFLDEKKKKKINYDDMSRDERGGMSARQLKRYEEMEQKGRESGRLLVDDFKNDDDGVELPYSNEELVLINLKMAQSFVALKRWEEAIAPYKYVIEKSESEEQQGLATMELVKVFIGNKQFDQVVDLILPLSKKEMRYDVRVNVAIMEAAAALAKNKQHDTALLMYRLVLPRKALILHKEDQMNEIRRSSGLPDIKVSVVTNDLGKTTSLLGYRQSNLQAILEAQEALGQLPPKPDELIALEGVVETMAGMSPYEDAILYQVGQLYASAGRPWEAVTALDDVASRDKDSVRSKRAFAEALLVYVNQLKKYDLVKERATEFLKTEKSGLGPRMVAHALASCYQAQGKWEELKGVLAIVKGFDPSDDRIIGKYECEMHYLYAVADLMLLNYKEARQSFTNVVEKYGHSHQRENCFYWHAMCGIFLQEYDKALGEIESFVDTYPRSPNLPSAKFHRGICLFALERYADAKAQYTEVIESYPGARVYSDACALRGDIWASDEAEGAYDLALADYREAIRTAKTEKQDSYPVFQMAGLFELNEEYERIITEVKGYLSRQGEQADVAKAAYWIGKTKIAQGKMDEAIEAYRETIVDYGSDIQQQGVDMIIAELVNVSKRLKEEPRAALTATLEKDIASTDSLTLQMRLRILVADIQGKRVECGKALIKEVEDFGIAPPPVLSAICEASFEAGDYSRAEEILNIFKTKFEESDFMRTAYKLRGYDLMAQQNYEGTLALIKEAQERYGAEADAAWAQLMKGRVQLEQGLFDEAYKTFRAVLDEREWRGIAFAEANYYLGVSLEKAGKYSDAFSWYQRTYVQYKGYAGGQWAADAYLASARCMGALGRENDRRNSYRAMLFDKYVNNLPQAEEARSYLGAAEVEGINTLIAQGVQTNITVNAKAEVTEL